MGIGSSSNKKSNLSLNKKSNLSSTKDRIQLNEKKPESPKKKLKRDWWQLCRDFCNVYIFFSISIKYSSIFAKVRDNSIAFKIKSRVQDVKVLKEWVISITQNFWDEFKIFPDLNGSFKNKDCIFQIKKQSKIIIAIIRKYLESLIINSTKLQDIPERVQGIIYNYIKDNNYFPKKYLPSYQINRIDFNFYGGTKKLQDDQVGMLIAFLIISEITVQQILLHIKANFVKFKKYPNIDIIAKYVGSIMHYLTRDTFNNNPTMLKDFLALMNYYRNYHLFNKEIELQDDIFDNKMTFSDEDEFADFLIPYNFIIEFWNLNPVFIEAFKNYVYSWATRLGKLIRLKYQKSDLNLKPIKHLKPPKDKTAANHVEKKNNVHLMKRKIKKKIYNIIIIEE